MTEDDLIAMAKEAGMSPNEDPKAVNALGNSVPLLWLTQFATLIAVREREACKTACDTTYYQFIGPEFGAVRYGIAACSSAIDARNK